MRGGQIEPRRRRGPTATHGRLRPAALALVVLAAVLVVLSPPSGEAADPLQPISVIPDQERIEVTALGRIYQGRGDSLQVDTAPGPDGMIGRMSVRASAPGTAPSWAVFALQNATDKPIERWLTAERYTAVGSGIVWPDLDARRIEAVTPSFGFLPERVNNDRADIFRITLDPGQTITYVAELSSDRFARIFLWKPLDYELKVRDRQLFNGIMLGITGLLAIFLTAVFAANHKAIFPSAALVGWCVLAYLCVDFGFWHKLLQLRAQDNALYRAATESAMAASFVIFLTTFLRLGSWNGFVRMLAGIWIAAQLALIAIAVIDPRLAATFARASFVVIGAVGALVTVFLAVSGQDRALALVPTWLLMLVWIFGAAVTLSGRLQGDIFVSGLVAGLVLIIVLLGFTVTQFAFRSFEPLYGALPNEMQMRSLAIEGAGAAVWEWYARRDEIKVSPMVEAALGLTAGELSAKVEDFAKHLHPADRERFRLLLWSVQERNGGSIRIDLRMRHADNSYRWFDLEAASIPRTDRRALRCVGLMRDVTESRRAQERLVQDAVHDSLTGLPNRALFVDRLTVAAARAGTDASIRPTILFIDIDRFRSVNSSLGLIVGDGLLLTIARRLARHLAPQDTLARTGGDQFAILITAKQDARELAMFAERVRRSLRSPIKIAGKDIVLTGSTGIAAWDGSQASPEDLLREAEIAMYRAKRGGPDRIEVFRPEMRSRGDDGADVEGELAKALERKQIRVVYQPVIYLPTEELAGFEAQMRWEHPRLGAVDPAAHVTDREESTLSVALASYLLSRAVQDAAQWHKELPRPDNPVFVSVNISSRQLFRQDIMQEVRAILGRAVVPPGSLRLEISESLAMENPERAVELLEWLRSAGAGLALDEFGAGYSSLAYLQRFAFDTIKIDRGLVQSSSGDGPGSAIVRSIVAVAHELGKKVMADGVEEVDDASFLRSLGCDFAQGAYYGEPMPEREVLQLLRAVRKSERRLQRRGYFRTKAAARKRRRPAVRAPATAAANGSAATAANGSAAAGSPPPLPPPAARAELPPSAARPAIAAPVGAAPGTNGGAPPNRLDRATAGLRLFGRMVRPRKKDVEAAKPATGLLPAPPLPLEPAARPSPGRQRPVTGGPRESTAPEQAGAPGRVPPRPARSPEQRPEARRIAIPPPVPAPPPVRAGAAPAPGMTGALPAPAVSAAGPAPPPARTGPPAARPAPRTPAAPAPAAVGGAGAGSPATPTPAPGPGGTGAAPPGVPASRPAPPAAAKPQFPALPPAIQKSLERLAGVPITEIAPEPQPRPPTRGPAAGRQPDRPAPGRGKSGKFAPG